jgi:hypothetical protein
VIVAKYGELHDGIDAYGIGGMGKRRSTKILETSCYSGGWVNPGARPFSVVKTKFFSRELSPGFMLYSQSSQGKRLHAGNRTLDHNFSADVKSQLSYLAVTL